jgi:hypothetical protein
MSPQKPPQIDQRSQRRDRSIGLRSPKTGTVGWGRYEAGLASIAASPLLHQLVRAGEPAGRVPGGAGRRGLATGHRRERVRDGPGWGGTAPQSRQGGRWWALGRRGAARARAAGPGRAADGLARKLGRGRMAENRQKSAIGQGALTERPGRAVQRAAKWADRHGCSLGGRG